MQIPWLYLTFPNINFFPWPSTKFPDFSLTFAKSGISLTFPWLLDTLSKFSSRLVVAAGAAVASHPYVRVHLYVLVLSFVSLYSIQGPLYLSNKTKQCVIGILISTDLAGVVCPDSKQAALFIHLFFQMMMMSQVFCWNI